MKKKQNQTDSSIEERLQKVQNDAEEKTRIARKVLSELERQQSKYK